ncbi:uncharacterized protein K452DRAFT_192894, partial [Aplosporella prunicola CBS 121167]
KKPPLTHFLCVPLVTEASIPQLTASLARFREDVVEGGAGGARNAGAEGAAAAGGNERGEGEAEATVTMPEQALRPLGTLHLTLGVMSLGTPERLQEAVTLLQELDLPSLLTTTAPAPSSSSSSPPPPPPPDAATDAATSTLPPQPQPPTLSLTSLHSMHPPRKTSVLYAVPDDASARLRPLCEAVRALFVQRGFLLDEGRPLKLHATLVNTLYARGGRGGKSHAEAEEDADAPADAPTAPSPVTTTPATRAPDPSPRARRKQNKGPLRLDATALLPRYADTVWAAEVPVPGFAVCEMGAKKVEDAR